MKLELSTDNLQRHIAALQGVRHPLAAPLTLEKAAEYIASSLQTGGYEVKKHPFMDNGSEYSNLIASLRGTTEPQDRLLVIAHYDTVANSPGADDNASGVAVLLELARLLAKKPLKKTVEFIAVNLEENERASEPKDLACAAAGRWPTMPVNRAGI